MFWKMESLFVLALLVLVAEVSFVAADDGKDFLHSFLCLPLLVLLSLSLLFFQRLLYYGFSNGIRLSTCSSLH